MVGTRPIDLPARRKSRNCSRIASMVEMICTNPSLGEFAVTSTCCVAKTHRQCGPSWIYMGFLDVLLTIGKNMQKMHGPHDDAPLTKSIRLIYLIIIGERIFDPVQRRTEKFRP